MVSRDDIVSIYMALRGSLTQAVMVIVPPKEVEDIVQETYVRVCQFNATNQIRDPRSFLFKTARNLALDHIKRSETRLSCSFDELPDYGLPENEKISDETFDEAATNEEFAQFCEAVRHLPVKCRRAFVLKKVYGYSQREIAREMDISESTVEKHIAQGIKRCTYFMIKHKKLSGEVGHLDRASRS